VHYLGLIVAGGLGSCGDLVYEGDSQYMYHLMSKHYKFDEICYLANSTGLLGVTNQTSKEIVTWAITEWLQTRSTENDIIFIFFAIHGTGHNNSYAVFDADGDEGSEVRETTIGIDVNGDGNVTDDWVGIDEAFITGKSGGDYESYTDDDLAMDLTVLNYSKLIFATTACFSGGFIDDLNATNRIVMTADSETDPASRAYTGRKMSPWACNFMDSLHGEVMRWNYTTKQLIHTGIEVDADANNDTQISLFEAWNYSWYNNPARLNGEDVPWIDDNGNGHPTYKNETYAPSEIDEYGDGSDGSLANETYLPRRYCNLTVETRKISGQSINDVDVWVDGELTGGSFVPFNVTAGGYNVKVESPICVGASNYYFAYWNGGSGGNPKYFDLHDVTHKTITAYYSLSPAGCPFVSSWNGTHYVLDNNLLVESARSSGEEVEDYYKLEQSLVPTFEGKVYSLYSLRLSEFQQEHSYLDQSQFMTVDHDANVSVAVSPFGEILTYQTPSAPVSAVDDQNEDQIELIEDIDDSYYEGYNGSYLILNFSEVTGENAKLVMRADPPPTKQSIHVQVLNSTEDWLDVVSIIPRWYWATEIVDLSSYLPSTGDLLIRLYFTDNHNVDYVGLDMSSQAEVDVEEASLLLAYHSDDGVVTAKLLSDDDVYAELEPGEQITLLFAAPSQSEGQRSFIIYTKGYYFALDN
jgi:hypothetical protein